MGGRTTRSMGGRSTSERPTGTRRLRLWHLAVAILASALVFGLVRAASVWAGSVAGGLLEIAGVVFLLILVSSYLAIIHLGVMLGRQATRDWEGWGIRKGGPIGLGIRTSARLARLAVFAGACLLGPAALIGLFLLLAYFLDIFVL